MLRQLLAGSFGLWDMIIYFLSTVTVIFITMPIHEFAHGYVATKLGDPTPRYQGRLTLNPLAHIDYMGALAMLLVGVGWANPVRINPQNFKNPKTGMAITALAGPVSNVILAFVALLLAKIFVIIPYGFVYYIAMFLTVVAQLSVYLAVFNFIPIPPFDGSRILFAILPDRYYFKVMQYERYLMIALLVIVATGALSRPIDFFSDAILNLINFITSLPFALILR